MLDNKGNVYVGIAVIGLIIVVAVVTGLYLFEIEDIPVMTTDDECEEVSECEGLTHIQCSGSWACVENLCSYKCGHYADGTFKLWLTDFPEEDIVSLNITINRIEVHNGDTGEWRDISRVQDEFDIMKLAKIKTMLGDENLPVGRYTQIRLYVENAKIRVVDDEVYYDVDIPSDMIRLVRGFEIVENETLEYVLDFDPGKSVKKFANEYKLDPVIRILTIDEFERRI